MGRDSHTLSHPPCSVASPDRQRNPLKSCVPTLPSLTGTLLPEGAGETGAGRCQWHRDPSVPCRRFHLQHRQNSGDPTGQKSSFWDRLSPPPSFGLLGLLGSLLAELNEGLSLFVPLPGLQQPEDLVSCQGGGEGWWDTLAAAPPDTAGLGAQRGSARLRHHVPEGLGCVRGRRVWGTRPASAWSWSVSRPGR